MHGTTNTTSDGMLAIWHGARKGWEPAFDDWYDNEHHYERLSIPGFLQARRYINLEATGPRYFSRYDVANPEVLASKEYLAAVNRPTDRTRFLMPCYTDTNRDIFRLVGRSGAASGGYLLSIRYLADHRSSLRSHFAGFAQARAATPDILQIGAWNADTDTSGMESNEKSLRGVADQHVFSVLLLEGSDLSRLKTATARYVIPMIKSATLVNYYQLVFVSTGA